jgi:hypothetical protein
MYITRNFSRNIVFKPAIIKYTAMSERGLNRRMEQSKATEYESRKAPPDVLKPPNISRIYIIRSIKYFD